MAISPPLPAVALPFDPALPFLPAVYIYERGGPLSLRKAIPKLPQRHYAWGVSNCPHTRVPSDNIVRANYMHCILLLKVHVWNQCISSSIHHQSSDVSKPILFVSIIRTKNFLTARTIPISHHVVKGGYPNRVCMCKSATYVPFASAGRPRLLFTPM